MRDNPFGGYPEVFGSNNITFNKSYTTETITVESKDTSSTYYLNSCLVDDISNNKKYDTLLLTTSSGWVDTVDIRTFYINNNKCIIECRNSDAGAIRGKLEIKSSDSYSDILGSGVYDGYVKNADSSTIYLADSDTLQQIELGEQLNVECLNIGYSDSSNSYNIVVITRIL